MANPHVLTWTNPTARVDGSAYTQAQNAGYQLAFDGAAAAVSIPLAWGTTFDMATLAAYQALTPGSHSVTLAVVDTNGEASAPSGAVTFSLIAAPNPPTGLKVS